MSLSEEERTTLVSLHLEKADVHLNQADEMAPLAHEFVEMIKERLV